MMDSYQDKNRGRFVTAVQLTKENAEDVAKWCSGHIVEEIDSLEPDKTYVGINLRAWHGDVARASEGDYILQDSLGEFLIRWPVEFESTFKKVEVE